MAQPDIAREAPALQGDGEEAHAISLYVNNKPGVLNRIGLVFSRRGWNIDSLCVSPAHDGQYARMSIVAQGNATQLSKIVAQLRKLVDVVHAEEHPAEEVITRDLALIKVHVGRLYRDEVTRMVALYGGRLIDESDTTVTYQIVGTVEEIDAAHAAISDHFRVLELVRSGAILIARGEATT